jgi:hypothetical protein
VVSKMMTRSAAFLASDAGFDVALMSAAPLMKDATKRFHRITPECASPDANAGIQGPLSRSAPPQRIRRVAAPRLPWANAIGRGKRATLWRSPLAV